MIEDSNELARHLDRLADLLFTRPSRIPKTPELESWIDAVTESIYSNPMRNRNGRSRPAVRKSVESMTVELALSESLGAHFEFKTDIDVTDRSTYDHDVVEPDTGLKFECKRHKTRFLTFPVDTVETFLKHCRDVDFLVSGSVIRYPDEYRVAFRLVAWGPSAEELAVVSQYDVARGEPKFCYYNHVHGAAPKFCRYNEDLHFTEAQLLTGRWDAD